MYIKHSPERITIKGYKKDDCTVNAIGSAIGLSYDLSRKILQTAVYYNGKFTFVKSKPRTKDSFTRRGHVKRVCEALSVDNHIYITDSELRERMKSKQHSHVKGVKLRDFARSNNEGIYIVLVRGHLAAVINGKIVDTWDSGGREVEIAYKIDVDHARRTIADLAKFYRMDCDKHIKKDHVSKILKGSL